MSQMTYGNLQCYVTPKGSHLSPAGKGRGVDKPFGLVYAPPVSRR